MRRGRSTLPALLVAGSLALTGCSGGSEPTTGTSSDPSSSSAPSPAAPSPAATAAADWLGGQLSDGLVVNEQYDLADVGLSIDVALGVADVDAATAEDVVAAVTEPRTLTGYVGDPDAAAYAGATAKAAVLVAELGGDPTDVGGTDLLAQLDRLVVDEGRTAGRVVDSGPDDYANVVGQTYALRALDGSPGGDGSEQRTVADRVADFLLAQQCADGGFRSTFSRPDAAEQGCADRDTADADTTALAVVALLGRAEDDAEAARAAEGAVDWLLDQQRDDGSFAGGVVGAQDAAPNANSTGLAGHALGLAGAADASRAAAGWVEDLQVGAEAPAPVADDAGAVAYDRVAFDQAARRGITVAQQDQWRRTTAQAVLALLAAGG